MDVRRGYYIRHIEEYLRYFPQENLSIVVFENMVADRESWVRGIYGILGATDIGFMPETLKDGGRVYASPSVRLKDDIVTRGARKIYKVMKKMPLLWRAREMVNPLFAEKFDRIKEDDRKLLRQIYEPYNERLCKFLDRDLGW